MNMFSMKCPHCSASLEVENGIDILVCEHCGGKIVLEGQSRDALNARVRVQEINQEKFRLEHQSKEKDREIDRELRRENARIEIETNRSKAQIKKASRYALITLVILGIAVAIISGIVSKRKTRINNEDEALEALVVEIQNLVSEGRYDEALSKTDLIVGGSDHRNWPEKKKELVQSIKQSRINGMRNKNVAINMSAKEFRSLIYSDAKKYIEKLGFINISVAQSAHKAGLFHNSGQVEIISINGDTDFDSEARFPLDAQIVISYYQ